MKKYLVTALVALVLTGCHYRLPGSGPQPVVVQPGQPNDGKVSPPITEPIPQPPKIETINWLGSVRPLIDQMLKTEGIAPGSVLLLDSVNNNTNGSLQITQVTSALHQALASNQTFSIVSPAQLSNAKKALNLSAQDSLASRSKAIGLARVVNAQYVLYSDVSGDVKSPMMEMQLMLVQTGEIIWSGDGSVNYK